MFSLLLTGTSLGGGDESDGSLSTLDKMVQSSIAQASLSCQWDPPLRGGEASFAIKKYVNGVVAAHRIGKAAATGEQIEKHLTTFKNPEVELKPEPDEGTLARIGNSIKQNWCKVGMTAVAIALLTQMLRDPTTLVETGAEYIPIIKDTAAASLNIIMEALDSAALWASITLVSCVKKFVIPHFETPNWHDIGISAALCLGWAAADATQVVMWNKGPLSDSQYFHIMAGLVSLIKDARDGGISTTKIPKSSAEILSIGMSLNSARTAGARSAGLPVAFSTGISAFMGNLLEKFTSIGQQV